MNNQNERKRIGAMIASIRIKKGYTQDELAERSGLLRPHISRIENGRYSVGLDTLAAIADGLGVKIDFTEK